MAPRPRVVLCGYGVLPGAWFRGTTGHILVSGALSAWRATAMLHAQPYHRAERGEATACLGPPLPCSIASWPPTARILLGLSHIHIRLLPEVRRPWLQPTIPSECIVQT